MKNQEPSDTSFLDFKMEFKTQELKEFIEYEKRLGYKAQPIFASDQQIWELYLEKLKK